MNIRKIVPKTTPTKIDKPSLKIQPEDRSVNEGDGIVVVAEGGVVASAEVAALPLPAKPDELADIDPSEDFTCTFGESACACFVSCRMKTIDAPLAPPPTNAATSETAKIFFFQLGSSTTAFAKRRLRASDGSDMGVPPVRQSIALHYLAVIPGEED